MVMLPDVLLLAWMLEARVLTAIPVVADSVSCALLWMGLAADELIEPLFVVTETLVPRTASTVTDPAAEMVTAWPTALPVCMMMPLPAPVKFACMLILPAPAVRIVRALRMLDEDAPAVRLTSPPPLLRLQTIRFAPAVKVMLAPLAASVSVVLLKTSEPVPESKLTLLPNPVCKVSVPPRLLKVMPFEDATLMFVAEPTAARAPVDNVPVPLPPS